MGEGRKDDGKEVQAAAMKAGREQALLMEKLEMIENLKGKVVNAKPPPSYFEAMIAKGEVPFEQSKTFLASGPYGVGEIKACIDDLQAHLLKYYAQLYRIEPDMPLDWQIEQLRRSHYPSPAPLSGDSPEPTHGLFKQVDLKDLAGALPPPFPNALSLMPKDPVGTIIPVSSQRVEDFRKKTFTKTKPGMLPDRRDEAKAKLPKVQASQTSASKQAQIQNQNQNQSSGLKTGALGNSSSNSKTQAQRMSALTTAGLTNRNQEAPAGVRRPKGVQGLGVDTLAERHSQNPTFRASPLHMAEPPKRTGGVLKAASFFQQKVEPSASQPLGPSALRPRPSLKLDAKSGLLKAETTSEIKLPSLKLTAPSGSPSPGGAGARRRGSILSAAPSPSSPNAPSLSLSPSTAKEGLGTSSQAGSPAVPATAGSVPNAQSQMAGALKDPGQASLSVPGRSAGGSAQSRGSPGGQGGDSSAGRRPSADTSNPVDLKSLEHHWKSPSPMVSITPLIDRNGRNALKPGKGGNGPQDLDSILKERQSGPFDFYQEYDRVDLSLRGVIDSLTRIADENATRIEKLDHAVDKEIGDGTSRFFWRDRVPRGLRKPLYFSKRDEGAYLGELEQHVETMYRNLVIQAEWNRRKIRLLQDKLTIMRGGIPKNPSTNTNDSRRAL